MLATRFKPVDHVCVTRGSKKLKNTNWHREAEKGNYFLRGFNHLLIFKKERLPEKKAKRDGTGRDGAKRR